MKDLMIDLETLGTNPNSVVLSIGAVFFDLDTKTTSHTFYQTLDIQEQLDAGRTLSGSTLTWWLSQSDEAKNAFKDGVKLNPALSAFTTWVKNIGGSDVSPWGNGSTFDISMLEDLLRHFGHAVPWKYTNAMDLRTFRRFIANGAKIPRDAGTHHNALDDAINQAKFVIEHNHHSSVGSK